MIALIDACWVLWRGDSWLLFSDFLINCTKKFFIQKGHLCNAKCLSFETQDVFFFHENRVCSSSFERWNEHITAFASIFNLG